MSSVIERTKKHIVRMLPTSQEVDIQVKRGPTGDFISRIHVRSKEGVLHAAKKALTYRRSLDESYHAIKKQIDKIKVKRLKVRKSRRLPTDVVASQ